MPPDPPAPPATDTLGQAFFRDGDPLARDGEPHEPGARVLRRFLLRLAVVLALLAAGDAVLRQVLPAEALLPWMEREFAAYTVKVARFAAGPAPDVAFLGNSRVHDGVVPEVLQDGLAAHWGRPARVVNLGLMNAKAAEFSALARAHFPDPPPRHVVIGLSGTEFVNVHEFQYASRFLWDAREFADWLARTPLAHFEVQHVENWLESLLGRAFHAFGVRDMLRTAAEERLEDLLAAAFGAPVPVKQRALRVQTGRYNQQDALSPTGRFEEQGPQPSLAKLLARDADGVRIPPYSLGDFSELARGDDFTLMREVLTELQARGCRVALVETPPSPWLQQRCPEFHGELFRTRMAAFAQSLGVPFVPMPPEETFLGDATYVDANHLSRAGARRYTKLLLERLVAAGFFDE